MIPHSVQYVGDTPSPAGPDYPIPFGDQSSPTVDFSGVDFSGDGHNMYDTGWMDIFWKMVNGVDGDQGDVAQGQMLDAYFLQLASHPDALQKLSSMLGSQQGGFDLDGFMDYFSQQQVMMATIYGYPGHPGSGPDAGAAWIATERAKYEALPPSSFRDHMIANLDALNTRLPTWYADHWDATKKQFYFTFTSTHTSPPITTTYYLDPTDTSDSRDRSMIYLMTACGGITGAKNTFWDSFDSDSFDVMYQVKTIDDMIKKGDSYIMIYMALLMMRSDGTYSDMNGTKSAINRTNKMVDAQTAMANFFHPSADAASQMSDKDAKAYAEALLDSLTSVETDGTFSSQVQQYITGDIGPALSTVISSDGKTTLGDMISQAQTSGNWQPLADALNALPAQSPPAAYSALKNALSAGNTDFTQLSKTEGVTSSTENTKIGQYTNSLSDSAKSWLDFVTYEIQHQTS